MRAHTYLIALALAACDSGGSTQAPDTGTAPPPPVVGSDAGRLPDATSPDAAPPVAPPSEELVDDTWAPSDPTTEPHPGVGAPPPVEGRRARRITVDQLRRSLPDLFGASWTTTQGGEEVVVLDALARTLGEPDYVEVTETVTEPTPLFHKFMEDLATQVCTKAVQADALLADPEQRHIARWPDDLNRTLRYLRLKFHGVYVPEDTPTAADGLSDYRTLFRDIRADADANPAWIGVCIAFFTAPEFMAW